MGGVAAARAAAAACLSFFLRVSSAPRLEVMGRREDEGERLAGRLLEAELLLAPPIDECFLLRECEEDRREDEYRGERLRDRAERLETKKKNDTNKLQCHAKHQDLREHSSV